MVTTLAGSNTATAGYANGIGSNALFSGTWGIAVDVSGNVFVAEQAGQRIRKVSPTGVVSTVAGTGTSGSVDGTGTSASFAGPREIAIDLSGNLYVATGEGCRIRKVSPSGVVSTFAGGALTSSIDGTGTQAGFASLRGVAVTPTGTVFVGEYGANRIRKITPTGQVTLLAGGTTSGYANGMGSNALFNSPEQVSVDVFGNVYVADLSNYRIRKITPAGGIFI